MKLRNLLIAAMGLSVVAGAAGAASAATPWQHHHPRRVEVNHRLGSLNHQIKVERREGDLSARQAAYMHAKLHRVRVQERRMAAVHRGHLTKHEQIRRGEGRFRQPRRRASSGIERSISSICAVRLPPEVFVVANCKMLCRLWLRA